MEEAQWNRPNQAGGSVMVWAGGKTPLVVSYEKVNANVYRDILENRCLPHTQEGSMETTDCSSDMYMYPIDKRINTPQPLEVLARDLTEELCALSIVNNKIVDSMP